MESNSICLIVGASLDGIYEDSIVEVKCPHVLFLKEAHPEDFDKPGVLTPKQLGRYCCERRFENGKNYSRLKKDHKFYYQCQFQMEITGYKRCRFIV